MYRMYIHILYIKIYGMANLDLNKTYYMIELIRYGLIMSL